MTARRLSSRRRCTTTLRVLSTAGRARADRVAAHALQQGVTESRDRRDRGVNHRRPRDTVVCLRHAERSARAGTVS